MLVQKRALTRHHDVDGSIRAYATCVTPKHHGCISLTIVSFFDSISLKYNINARLKRIAPFILITIDNLLNSYVTTQLCKIQVVKYDSLYLRC